VLLLEAPEGNQRLQITMAHSPAVVHYQAQLRTESLRRRRRERSFADFQPVLSLREIAWSLNQYEDRHVNLLSGQQIGHRMFDLAEHKLTQASNAECRFNKHLDKQHASITTVNEPS
jgi:hypothetical protein